METVTADAGGIRHAGTTDRGVGQRNGGSDTVICTADRYGELLRSRCH